MESITIANSGSGYVTAPTVTFTGGGGTTQATATAVIKSGSVTRIDLLTRGVGYTTTPSIVLSGGGAGGVTPTDIAKAYANLGNDLVRDFNVTLKFDRIDQKATVLEWKASTSYAYHTLIRYQDELYRITSAFTSTTKFNDII